ncbi:MAG: putative metal-binding motif-containing protein, partial [Phycisphaerales bacterium]
AQEICDALDTDEDCDQLADDNDPSAIGQTTFYADADNDTYTGSSSADFCDMPAGYEPTNEGDCDDADPTAFPGAPETCSDLGVDNDCDGSVAEDEAIDALTFYADADNDGAGDPNATILACNAPAGYVAVAGDNCPNTTDVFEPTTWYGDTDNDGVGDANDTLTACDQPAGYVGISGDTCPLDGNKTEPGACGCGIADTDSDSDGNPDCYGQIAELTLTSDLFVYGPAEQVLVRLSSGASGTGLRGADLSIVFNAFQLELVSVSPVAGSPYSVEVSESIDNIAGELRYSVAVPAGDADNFAAADVADLVFNIRPSAAFCSTSGLVTFGTVGGLESRMVTTTSVPMVPVVSPMNAISVLSTPPSFVSVPADVSVATDAGSLVGAFVAEPVVTAADACSGAATVTVAITYPDATGQAEPPVDGVFPIGTSLVEWTATDEIGQISTLSQTISVANYQLLDVDVSLIGSIAGGNTSRTIRVTVGGAPQLFEVDMLAGVGQVTGIQVPVAAEYPCLLVKDPEHSLSRSAAASVAGVRYAATASLAQGDSNDDNLVDIIDFGIFFGDYGVDPTGRGISNFNADTFVSNADFGFIALNYLTAGETCGGYDAPGQPRSRISVKELRRRGLGELARADFNNDGWLDQRDVAIYMSGRAPLPYSAE